MNCFLHTKLVSGEPIWVNIDYVASAEPGDDDGTRLIDHLGRALEVEILFDDFVDQTRSIRAREPGECW